MNYNDKACRIYEQNALRQATGELIRPGGMTLMEKFFRIVPFHQR